MWELKRATLPNVTYCHMFQIGLLLELDKQAALNYHLHFHHVLIKTTSRCLFADRKSESKQKWGEFMLKWRKHMYVYRSGQQFSQSL